MRIISGVLKGKSVNFLKNSISRPLKDSVKENIFNVLKHSKLINADIENADVLDLYSGVGSFGLECISRGAKKVLFVEQDKMAFKILKDNLLKLSVENKASVINSSVDNIFENNEKNKFNFFFFDPPFNNNDYIKILNQIKKNKMYKPKNIVIIHREKKTIDNFDGIIDVLLTKQYGRSKIIFGMF